MKAGIKKCINGINSIYVWVVAGMIGMVGSAFAQSNNTLDDIRKQAKTVDIAKTQAKVDSGTNLLVNIAVAFSGLAGIVILIISLLALHKAGQDESGRTSKTGPVIGLIIGGCLIAISVIAAFATGVVSSILG